MFGNDLSGHVLLWQNLNFWTFLTSQVSDLYFNSTCLICDRDFLNVTLSDTLNIFKICSFSHCNVSKTLHSMKTTFMKGFCCPQPSLSMHNWSSKAEWYDRKILLEVMSTESEHISCECSAKALRVSPITLYKTHSTGYGWSYYISSLKLLLQWAEFSPVLFSTFHHRDCSIMKTTTASVCVASVSRGVHTAPTSQNNFHAFCLFYLSFFYHSFKIML